MTLDDHAKHHIEHAKYHADHAMHHADHAKDHANMTRHSRVIFWLISVVLVFMVFHAGWHIFEWLYLEQ